MDAFNIEPFFRGRSEEVIAGSLAVQILSKMASTVGKSDARQALHRDARECASHYRAALHAYAEGSYATDASRLAVIWRVSLMFAALFAGDMEELKSHVIEFQSALLTFELHCVEYKEQWVIRRVLKLVRLSVGVLFPGYALVVSASQGMCKLVPDPERFKLV